MRVVAAGWHRIPGGGRHGVARGARQGVGRFGVGRRCGARPPGGRQAAWPGRVSQTHTGGTLATREGLPTPVAGRRADRTGDPGARSTLAAAGPSTHRRPCWAAEPLGASRTFPGCSSDQQAATAAVARTGWGDEGVAVGLHGKAGCAVAVGRAGAARSGRSPGAAASGEGWGARPRCCPGETVGQARRSTFWRRSEPRATSRPAVSVMVTSHTCWVRPCCTGTAMTVTRPVVIERRKSVLLWTPTAIWP